MGMNIQNKRWKQNLAVVYKQYINASKLSWVDGWMEVRRGVRLKRAGSQLLENKFICRTELAKAGWAGTWAYNSGVDFRWMPGRGLSRLGIWTAKNVPFLPSCFMTKL